MKGLLPRGTRVGHTGTLDPLASGLLVLLIGRATRLSRYVTHLEKTYTATARFGAVSDTLDADGEISQIDAPMPDERTLSAALPDFTGKLLQTPPMASAIKVGGRRLYSLHRRGLTVEREPRLITIHSLTLTAFDPKQQRATFEVSCSSGTYVRALFSDLATSLDTGAYLTALRRTKVGHLSVENASSPEDLSPATPFNHMVQMSQAVAHLPGLAVDAEGERLVASGRVLRANGMKGSFRVEREGELLAVYRGDGEVARAEVVLCGG
ncbi:MAG: tRNA pseudouridine(55) synthase TruB [Actinomycetota bacterium]|nr:tRNA pseudouridine(55) synthase TruB [Actinomycetota bacterium]